MFGELLTNSRTSYPNSVVEERQGTVLPLASRSLNQKPRGNIAELTTYRAKTNLELGHAIYITDARETGLVEV